MVTAVGRAVLSLPAPVARAFLGAPIEREGRVLDAQVQLALLLSKLTGGEPSHVVGVERARLIEGQAHRGGLMRSRATSSTVSALSTRLNGGMM